MRTRTLNYIAALLLLTAFSSCQKQPVGPVEPGIEKKDETTITLNVPAPTTMATRTMTAKEECEILTIDVLVFNASTDEYMYYEKGVDIVDGTLATDKKFTMKIKQTTSPASVYLLVYANVSQEIEAAIADGTIATTKSRDQIMRSLTFSLPIDTSVDDQGGKWLVKPGRYTRFPMWGQSAEIALTDATITVAPVTLLRACAKIDIGLSFNGENTTQLNFYLEEFYLYNAMNKLYIAPDPSNLSGAAVTAETVPATAEPFGVIKYLRRENKGAAGFKEFLSEIYLAEHPQGSATNRSTNPCIVVGARFGASTSTLITYYRIDLVKTITDVNEVVTSQQYLPILRNHRYKINIIRVHARGYDTPAEAFNASGLNTNLDVVIENQDESITDIVYDGQYMLGVDKKAYTEDKRVITPDQAKVLKISTNYEDGWKISTNQTWLKFVNDADVEVATLTGVTGQTNVRFTLAANNTGVQRVATITLQAGRLFQTITVTQTIVNDIETTNFLATIYSMNGVSKTFTVKSAYPWKAKIVDDNYNLITAFTASGVASSGGTTFTFNTMNEILENNLSVATERQTVKIVLYSPTGEFEDFVQPITLDTYWELPAITAFYVYGKDQAYATWYLQNNVTENVNNSNSPGTQIVPARTGSCAAIPSLDPAKPWRVPTLTELGTMAGSSSILAFVSTNYWSSASYSTNSFGYYTPLPSGSPVSWAQKTTGYPARCVRTK